MAFNVIQQKEQNGLIVDSGYTQPPAILNSGFNQLGFAWGSSTNKGTFSVKLTVDGNVLFNKHCKLSEPGAAGLVITTDQPTTTVIDNSPINGASANVSLAESVETFELVIEVSGNIKNEFTVEGSDASPGISMFLLGSGHAKLTHTAIKIV